MSDSYDDSDFECEDGSVGATIDTREDQAAHAYAKFRGAFGGAPESSLGSSTVATQTDDSWLPDLIQKIVKQRVRQVRTEKKKKENELQSSKSDSNIKSRSSVLRSVESFQSFLESPLPNFSAFSPAPSPSTIDSSMRIARAHRVAALNSRVYCRSRKLDGKQGARNVNRKGRKRNRKREQRNAMVKLLQDLRRVIEHNRNGAKRLFQQVDRCGDGTLGVSELRKVLKKLGLSTTQSDCLAIIRSTRTRSTDSSATVNYFTVLRAVRLPQWPVCGQPSALHLALGWENPREVTPHPIANKTKNAENSGKSATESSSSESGCLSQPKQEVVTSAPKIEKHSSWDNDTNQEHAPLQGESEGGIGTKRIEELRQSVEKQSARLEQIQAKLGQAEHEAQTCQPVEHMSDCDASTLMDYHGNNTDVSPIFDEKTGTSQIDNDPCTFSTESSCKVASLQERTDRLLMPSTESESRESPPQKRQELTLLESPLYNPLNPAVRNYEVTQGSSEPNEEEQSERIQEVSPEVSDYEEDGFVDDSCHAQNCESEIKELPCTADNKENEMSGPVVEPRTAGVFMKPRSLRANKKKKKKKYY